MSSEAGQSPHPDPILALIEAEGLGTVVSRSPLKVRFKHDNLTFNGVELCRTERGLWLLAQAPTASLVVSVLGAASFAYEPGVISDRLIIFDNELSISGNTRKAVRDALALARQGLRTPVRREPQLTHLPDLRHVEEATPIERALLDGLIERDEVLLGFVHAKSDLEISSALTGTARARVRLFVSERRALLLALSELGDLREATIDAPISVETKLSRAQFVVSGIRVVSQRRSARLFSELAGLTRFAPAERLRECARLNFVTGEARYVAATRLLLARSRELGDPVAWFAELSLGIYQGQPLPSSEELELGVSALASANVQSSALGELFCAWRLPFHVGLRLVQALSALGGRAEPWALDLHEKVHAERVAASSARSDKAKADIAFAEHLIARAEHQRAGALLDARLAEMPSEALEDLLPPGDADLTQGRGGQALRIRIYELLAEARGGPNGPDVTLLAELARLQPLVRARLALLCEHAHGSLAERTAALLRQFEPRASDPRDERASLVDPGKLADALVEDVLPHPLVQRGGDFIGSLQALLASVPVPDYGVLRDYCEGLSSGRYPLAAKALRDAARALGVPGVEGYISRGAKGVGLRAYDGNPPFVLIGGRHLEPEDAYHMTEPELYFAVSAELAHLRYGHTRVTSSEVWAGALSKSRAGLDLALGALPALRGLKVGGHAQKIVAKIPAETLRSVLTNLGRYAEQLGAFPNASEAGSEAVLSRLNEELVAAHRVMQLTADRAGLLLAGDVRAAVRAMLLVRTDYRELENDMSLNGLDALLSRRTADGRMAHQDLAVRIAALFGFYLSDDYERLRSELGVKS